MGVEFGAAVAADREQGQVGGVSENRPPDFREALVHERGPFVHETLDVVAQPEPLGQRLIEIADAFLDR